MISALWRKMISTVRVLVIIVVLVRSGRGQQCTELYCPGNGCLARNSVCNGMVECSGRGSNFDETNCNGKIRNICRYMAGSCSLKTILKLWATL